jgi:ketosteroid isomerase-like protein
MLRKLSLVLIVIMLGALAGCATKKVDLEGERAALRTADTEWSAAVGNIETFVTYVAPDGVIQAPYEPAVVGVDNIRAWGTKMFAAPGFTVSWQPQTVEVAASGDMGWTAGTYTFSAQGPDGTPMTDHGKYLCTWKKDASGAWKVAYDTWNTDVAMMMPETAPADTTATPKQ